MATKVKLICAVLAVALLCAGCSVLTVDEMYTLPKRSEDYNDLQSAIDGAMSGLEYSAPLTGENQQTVQGADLDGDGDEEYLLFRNVDGTYVNTDTVECNGTSFDQVEYVDMDGRGGVEIIVGRQLSDQVVRSASVYAFMDGELVQLVSMNYTKFLTTDLDGDSLAELFLLHPGQTDTDNGIAELYSMKNGVLERYNEVVMSQPVDKLKRIITGKLDGGTAAVYVASAAGDTALITDVYSLLEDKLVNVTLSNESGTSVQTMRNYYVYADDIDNDGVVELPFLISMLSLSDTSSRDTHQLIRWYAMTPDGGEVDKMYTYHDFLGGWYMQLDSAWASRLTVVDMGYQYAFYVWDDEYSSSEKLMTVYAFSGQNREEQALSEGRFMLYKTESTVYAARLEECAANYGVTQESAVYSFRLIQEDWKTGEM